MNNQDTINESIIIEDLAAKNAEEVKGGPTPKVKRDLVMKSSVAESGSGDNSLQGVSLNHNETVSEDNESIIIEDLAAKNAEEVKGGPTPKIKRDLVLKSSVAESGNGDNSLQGVSLNHNETVVSDEAEEDVDSAYLADLTTTEKDEEQIKGGNYSCPAWRCGFNHNETVANDADDNDEAEATNLADLPVSDQQSSEIAGGLLVPAVQKVREAAAR